jgi:hypothetical protein
MNGTANSERRFGVYSVDDCWPAIERLYERMGRDADKVLDPVTLEQVLEIEPRAKHLLAMAGSYCKDCDFYSGLRLKSAVIRLVGDFANKPELRSPAAYDVLYDAVYDRMSNGCQRCSSEDDEGREGWR